jgi:hypothetical protein
MAKLENWTAFREIHLYIKMEVKKMSEVAETQEDQIESDEIVDEEATTDSDVDSEDQAD